MRRRRTVVMVLGLVGALVAPGCVAPLSASPKPIRDCSKDALPTLYQGIFTFGTDQPAYPPWYIGDNPANGEGFEAAVAYALAEELGYAIDEVRWVREPFSTAMAAGPKSFDANLSEFSITEPRRKLVDFSTPYYDVTQAVMTVASSPAARVTTLEGLQPLRIGAQVGSTSATAAGAVGADLPVEVYNTNVDAKIALRSGEIDALVLDMPTAFAAAAELAGGIVVGRLPAGRDVVEQFGVVLDKGSPLTPCVSGAVETLREDGVLAELEKKWLAAGTLPRLLS